MANTTSAKKMVRKIAAKTERNRIVKSRVRSFLKKVELAIESKDKKEANLLLHTAESEIMKAVRKGIFKKNTGARKVSRLSKRIKTIAA